MTVNPSSDKATHDALIALLEPGRALALRYMGEKQARALAFFDQNPEKNQQLLDQLRAQCRSPLERKVLACFPNTNNQTSLEVALEGGLWDRALHLLEDGAGSSIATTSGRNPWNTVLRGLSKCGWTHGKSHDLVPDPAVLVQFLALYQKLVETTDTFPNTSNGAIQQACQSTSPDLALPMLDILKKEGHFDPLCRDAMAALRISCLSVNPAIVEKLLEWGVCVPALPKPDPEAFANADEYRDAMDDYQDNDLWDHVVRCEVFGHVDRLKSGQISRMLEVLDEARIPFDEEFFKAGTNKIRREWLRTEIDTWLDRRHLQSVLPTQDPDLADRPRLRL
jgi:hypothetical protein